MVKRPTRTDSRDIAGLVTSTPRWLTQPCRGSPWPECASHRRGTGGLARHDHLDSHPGPPRRRRPNYLGGWVECLDVRMGPLHWPRGWPSPVLSLQRRAGHPASMDLGWTLGSFSSPTPSSAGTCRLTAAGGTDHGPAGPAFSSLAPGSRLAYRGTSRGVALKTPSWRNADETDNLSLRAGPGATPECCGTFSLGYRPVLDGVSAVAVGAVLIAHVGLALPDLPLGLRRVCAVPERPAHPYRDVAVIYRCLTASSSASSS